MSPQFIDREHYFTHKDLLHQGWSAGAIKRFLGEPDVLFDNHHCAFGGKIKSYHKDRVLIMESDPQFVDWFNKTATQRAQQSARSIKRSTEQKRKAVLFVVQSLTHNFPDMGEVEMTRAAMAHNRNRVLCLGKDEPLSITHENQKYALFLNYLADNYSNLEDVTDSLYGHVGRSNAERVCKTIFEARAIKQYSFLAEYRNGILAA